MHGRIFRGCCWAMIIASTASASDWTQWRGPHHNNVAESGQAVPFEWTASKNVVWKTDVPGRGHSTPIVFGNMVVLTSALEQGQEQVILAFDRTTGKQLWVTSISQGGFASIHPKNTFASPSPATDGTQIYATFCHHARIEAVAVDLQGKIVWRTDVGAFHPKLYEYGYAASPTLYNGTMIINADCDTVAWLKALDTKTGKVVWEQQRQEMLNWSSPVVGTVAGREQLLLSGTNKIASYDPASGTPLWEVPCLTMATCGTVVWEGDTVFASGGYPKAETVAVKLNGDGSGKVLWKNNVMCYEQSLVVHAGHLYAFSDKGIVYCWNAQTGKEQWKERLQGPVSASPLLVGETIFATNELGTTWAFKANPEKFEQVAENQLGNSSFASAVAVDGRIFLRTAEGNGAGRKETLYCLGTK